MSEKSVEVTLIDEFDDILEEDRVGKTPPESLRQDGGVRFEALLDKIMMT